jgi:TolB protein
MRPSLVLMTVVAASTVSGAGPVAAGNAKTDQIAYVCDRGGSARICLIDADGTGRRSVTEQHAERYDVDPSWSPDGKRIAFARETSAGPWGIYTFDVRSGRERLLITNKVDARHPSWSPDGRKIAFTALTETPRTVDYTGIYVMDADGGRARRLTPIDQWADQAAWSPDGRRIAFLRWLPQKTGRVRAIASLRVMSASGTHERELVHRATAPAWSPDGKRLAYTSSRVEICVVHADGSSPRCLTRNDVRDSDPSWSPDGRWIAFDSDRANRERDLYVIGARGGAARRLTRSTHGGEAYSPSWRPRP